MINQTQQIISINLDVTDYYYERDPHHKPNIERLLSRDINQR